MRVEELEARRLFAAVYPSAVDQYMVELINRARANPLAEAARLGIDLNEGVPADQTISGDAKQPLAINPFLTDAAHTHSQWMLDNDIFEHTGAGGSTPGDRMQTAGYSFTGSYSWGENLAYSGNTGSLEDAVAMTAQLHQNLFVDDGYPDRGHRTDMLAADFREVGAGLVPGPFTRVGTTYNVLMATTDFAASGPTSFLTGVAFDDATTRDSFYTPGEGLGSVTITARRVSDGAIFQTGTWSSGGYTLGLAGGTYTVTASGGSLDHPIAYNNVVIGDQNVKVDFNSAIIPGVSLGADGVLSITGTAAADTISLVMSGGALLVTAGNSQSFPLEQVRAISVRGLGSNDSITLGSDVPVPATLVGGAGDDTLAGGAAGDLLNGSGGNDSLSGAGGADALRGGADADTLNGQKGRDSVLGGPGDDWVYGGGGADRLSGGVGADHLFGGGGNDQFSTQDNEQDTLDGGAGANLGQVDVIDVLSSVAVA